MDHVIQMMHQYIKSLNSAVVNVNNKATTCSLEVQKFIGKMTAGLED